MYLNAIEVMIGIGKRGWDDRCVSFEGLRVVAVGPGVWRQGYDVEVDMKNSQKQGDPLQLKTSHIVTGLWETMVQVADNNFYYETILTLKQHYRDIGTVAIKELTVAATANNMNADTNLFSTSALLRNADLATTKAIPVNLTAGPSYPAGRIADRGDPRLTIMYTYTRTQINSKDIFMAIIGLLADAAQYAPNRPLEAMQQISPSQRCTISLRPFPAPIQATYGFAVRGLRDLIYFIMLQLEKFGEMTFVLEYQGYRLVEGYVKARVPAPGVAAEKE